MRLLVWPCTSRMSRMCRMRYNVEAGGWMTPSKTCWALTQPRAPDASSPPTLMVVVVVVVVFRIWLDLQSAG